MAIVKNIVKKAINVIGFDISRRKQPNTKWLQDLRIRTFIDIGANNGEYSLQIRELFPEVQIYAFEPIEECYSDLLKTMANDSRFTSFNCALGKENQVIGMYKNEHSPASSILGMKDLHKHHFDYAHAVEKEKVVVRRLDDCSQDMLIADPLMIKMDVQGYEDNVIAGGENVIGRARVVIIECAFEELYEGQPLFDDIYSRMRGLGFRYGGSNHQVKSQLDRRVLQENSVFLKS